MCMCVCRYIYTCIFMLNFLCTHVYIYTFHIYVYVSTCIYLYIYISVHMYINIHIRVYVHTHIRKKFLKHYRWCLRQRRWYACVCVCLRVTWAVNRIASISTEWRRPIGCLKLQVIRAKEPLITGLFCRK